MLYIKYLETNAIITIRQTKNHFDTRLKQQTKNTNLELGKHLRENEFTYKENNIEILEKERKLMLP